MYRSASGAGRSPSFSSRARMNASIGFRTQLAFFTRGSGGRFGFAYAQCSAYGAPCAIQRWMTRTS